MKNSLWLWQNINMIGEILKIGSYTASTKGHIKNFGTFANSAYKLNENQIFQFFLGQMTIALRSSTIVTN